MGTESRFLQQNQQRLNWGTRFVKYPEEQKQGECGGKESKKREVCGERTRVLLHFLEFWPEVDPLLEPPTFHPASYHPSTSIKTQPNSPIQNNQTFSCIM